MTLKRYNGSSFETVPFRVYDGSNWRGTPLYRYNGTEWVDAYLDDGLVAYYPFDGDLQDYSGNGNDGTDNTSAGFVSGRIGSDAKDFDGNDDYVELPDFGIDSSADFTISAWAKFDGTGSSETVIGRYDGTNDILYLRAATDDTFEFKIGHTGGNQIAPRGGTRTANDWFHLVVVFDSGGPTGDLYVNNSLIESDTSTVDNFDTTDGPWIGARTDGATYMSGSVDDVRIYSKALSSAEIDHLYQHGRVV